MIGYLQGVVRSLSPVSLIVVGGVGYQVALTRRQLSTITVGEEVELFIHTHVREEALELYGFATEAECSLFRLLLTVSGVGPRMALGLLNLGPDRLLTAIQRAELSTLTSIPRVGKKLAQKIIIDLTPKLGSVSELSLGPRSNKEQELVAALLALGMNEAEIYELLPSLPTKAGELSTAELVKQALSLLSTKSEL